MSYSPLFKAGRPVFNVAGAPVFVNVRSGAFRVTLSATGSWTGTADGIPNGSVFGSSDAVFTRTSYSTYTAAGSTGSWHAYLGKNEYGVDYYVILLLESASFAFYPASHCFKLLHTWRCFPHSDPSSTQGSTLGTNSRPATSVKSSSLFIPEGDYAPNWTVYTGGWGARIDLPSSYSGTFS